MRMNTEIMKRLDMMEKGDVNSVIDSFLKREREENMARAICNFIDEKNLYLIPGKCQLR